MQTNKLKSEQFLIVGIVISMVIWGINWPSGKILTHYGTPVNIMFCRFIVVFFTMLPLLLILKVDLKVKKEGYLTLFVASILMAIYNYLFLKGLSLGLAGAGGVLATTLSPILAYALGLIISRKMPSKNEKIGLTLGFIAGIILLKAWLNYAKLLDSGNLYFFLAALVWALISKLTSKASLYGTSMGFSLWIYLITLCIMIWFIDFPETLHIVKNGDLIFWTNLFYNGFISTCLATSFYFYATTRLGAEQASSYIFLVPASAALSSLVMLEEKILIHTIVGGALGMLAVYIINKKGIPNIK